MYKWDPKENPCSMDGDLDGNASLFTPHPIRQLKPADHVRDSIESHLAHVQQLSINLAKRDINEFSSLISSVERSLSGLKQEVHAVKQLGGSRNGSSPQQQLSSVGFHSTSGELLEPLPAGLPARLSTPLRRSTLAYSDTSASRRSSLGPRLQYQPWEGSAPGSVAEGPSTVEERIYAGIASALKAAAVSASARSPGKASAAGHAGCAAAAAGNWDAAAPGSAGAAARSPQAGHKSGELDAVEAGAADAATVAAAMQELAAATAAEQLGQQLQHQLRRLEQEVAALKQQATVDTKEPSQDAVQQLQEQQQGLQQSANAWHLQLQEQQQSIAALAAEVQQLRKQQQEENTGMLAAVQQLLEDVRQQSQERLAQLSKQQEERMSLLMEDLREELLDRLDGLQLRLQAVEEEQEQLQEQQQRQRQDIQQLQPLLQQRQQERVADPPALQQQQAPATRQRVSAPSTAAAAASSTHAHTDGGALSMLPPGFMLLEMADMLPTSISDPDGDNVSRQMPAAVQAAGSDLPHAEKPQQQQADLVGLSARVQELADQQQQRLAGVLERLDAVEQQQQQAATAPLDAMTRAAVEARLAVLEEGRSEQRQQLQDTQEQLDTLVKEHQLVQQQQGQLARDAPVEQQPDGSRSLPADTLARIAGLEAAQQELKEQQQRLEAAQQQFAAGDSSCTSLDSQPSSVKERIQHFEEQLSAAVKRFAPSQAGSRSGTAGGSAGFATEATPLHTGRKTPDREASLRELLANMQADVALLMSSASSSKAASTSSIDGAADAGAAMAAATVLPQQLQQQLAKLTQNCAELGEAVLQLELQLQQVDEHVRQQHQQTVSAVQSPTAATYISKGAAHEAERMVQQLQQLSAAAKSFTGADCAGAAGASDASHLPSAVLDSTAAASSCDQQAQQLQTLQDDMQQWKQQLAQQQEQAQEAAAMHKQLLDSLAAAQQDLQQQLQQQGGATELQALQAAALQQPCEQQQVACGELLQQMQQHAAALAKLQEASQSCSQLQQLVQQHLAQTASTDALQQHEQRSSQQLDVLQQQLAELSTNVEGVQRQLAQQQAASSAVAALQEQLYKAQEQLLQQGQQGDELSSLLFSTRVELQNGFEEVEHRLKGVEGLKEDMGIWEDSRKAAAARTEAAAAKALHKVESALASLQQRQAQQAAAAGSSVADLQAQLQQLQEQLLPMPQQLQQLQQQAAPLQQQLQELQQRVDVLLQLHAAEQEHATQLNNLQQQVTPLLHQLQQLEQQLQASQQEQAKHIEGAQEASGQQLQGLQAQMDQCRQQLQQEQPQAQQWHDELQHKLSQIHEELQAQLLLQDSQLKQQGMQLQQHAELSQQIQQQQEAALQAQAQLQQQVLVVKDGQAQLQVTWEAQEAQQHAAGQQQQAATEQLQQLSQQLAALQEVQAAHGSSLRDQVADMKAASKDSRQHVSDLQQQHCDDLKADPEQQAQQIEQQLAAHVTPLQEQVFALQQEHQQHLQRQQEEVAADGKQLQSQLDSLQAEVLQVQQGHGQQHDSLQQQCMAVAQSQAQHQQQLQQLQQDLSALQQKLKDTAAAAAADGQQRQQEADHTLQQSFTDQLSKVQSQLGGQVSGLQQAVDELSSKAQLLQELPAQVAAAQANQEAAQHQLGQLQQHSDALGHKLQQQSDRLEQEMRQQLLQQSEQLQQQAGKLQQDVQQQLQHHSCELRDACTALKQDLGEQQQKQLKQLKSQLGDSQQQQHKHTLALLADVQQLQRQHADQVQGWSQKQQQQQCSLQELQQQTQQQVQQVQQLLQQQEQQQLEVTGLAQEQHQGAQRLQQLQVQVEELSSGFAQAVLDVQAAIQHAAEADKQVFQLRGDLEEALGCMAPFLSPVASSLTSPGATPLTSPTKRGHSAAAAAGAPGFYRGYAAQATLAAAAAVGGPVSPAAVTYSFNPLHGGAAGAPGYSVTIDIGAPAGSHSSALQQRALQWRQQQQQCTVSLDGAQSAAGSRRVSQQDSATAAAAAVPAANTPFCDLRRQRLQQLERLDGAEASAAAAAAEAGGDAERDAALVESPGSSPTRLTRCASLDSPSFRAAALAGVSYSYGPTPPARPSTGPRPYRGQLSFAAAAAAAAATDGSPATQEAAAGGHTFEGLLQVTPVARAGADPAAAHAASSSSAGRLLRTGSLDSPAHLSAAAAPGAGRATEASVSARGRVDRAASAGVGGNSSSSGGGSKLGVPLDAADTAMRVFVALNASRQPSGLDPHSGEAAAAAAVGGDSTPAAATAGEGMGSLSSSAIWSARGSAVFDNSLFDTPRRGRRKSKAGAATATPASPAHAAAAAAAGAVIGNGAAAGEDGALSDSDAASSDSEGGHSRLVSLTDSLTAQQLRRLQLQQQQQSGPGATGLPALWGSSPPLTPAVGVLPATEGGSSPATAATPVSVYMNLAYEGDGEGVLPQGAFRTADRPADWQASVPISDRQQEQPQQAALAQQPSAAKTGSGRSVACAAGAADGMPASATPPSLGSWQKKRQQQQDQQQRPNLPLLHQQDPAAAATPSSCNFAATCGQVSGDSPTLLPQQGTWKEQQQARQQLPPQQQQQQQLQEDESPDQRMHIAPPGKLQSPALAALLFEDSSSGGEEEAEAQQQTQPQPAALSAELLQQHTLQQQRQHKSSNMQLPWLQQQQQQQLLHRQPAGATVPGVPGRDSAGTAAVSAVREPCSPPMLPAARQLSADAAAQAAAGAGLSPMLSEWASLGAEVIDLEGSEADSDLLAVTPDRPVSKRSDGGPAGLQLGRADSTSRQLLFEEPSGGWDGASAGAGTESSGHVGDAAAAEGQQQEVLRLRGGAGYEPHDDADLGGCEVGGEEDAWDWELHGEGSFDLADYCSSSSAGGDEGSLDGDSWEVVPSIVQLSGPEGQRPAASGSNIVDSSSRNTSAGGTAQQHWPAAAAVTAPGAAAASAAACAKGGGSSGISGASSAAAAEAEGAATASASRRRSLPEGWLRAGPPGGWQVGMAPTGAWRVALFTSSKPGSGTKTRATLAITGHSSSGAAAWEHRLAGGKRRCSYPPGSTKQDLMLLQQHSQRPVMPLASNAAGSSGSSSGGSSSSGGGREQEAGVHAAAAAAPPAVRSISGVSVCHDAAGFSGAWLLDCVILQHLKSGDWWQFGNRAGWVKGARQAKAVAANAPHAGSGCTPAGEGAEAGPAADAADEASTALGAQPTPAWRQLHLAANGVAANCPLPPMPIFAPSTSSSSSAGACLTDGRAGAAAGIETIDLKLRSSGSAACTQTAQQPLQQLQGGTAAASVPQGGTSAASLAASSSRSGSGGGGSNSSRGGTADGSGPRQAALEAGLAAVPTTAPTTASGGSAAAAAAAGALMRGDSNITCPPAAFVPLDDVELKLRGSPRKLGSSSNNRSCSPSPSHRTHQQQQQQQQQLFANAEHRAAEAAAGSMSSFISPLLRAPGATATPSAAPRRLTGDGLCSSIAALLTQAGTPAAAAAAWGTLGSRRSSAGERRYPAARRVSGSIAPAKLVPLSPGRDGSGSCEGGLGTIAEAAGVAALERVSSKAGSVLAAGAVDDVTAGQTIAAHTHSADGTPCRLVVRCSSSYLGRISSGGGQQQGSRGVHFLGYAEQVEFDAAAMQGSGRGGPGSAGSSSSSSIQSFTEEQLLEAQGGWEFVKPPQQSSSYTTLISTAQREAAAPAPADPSATPSTTDATAALATAAAAGELQEVSLVVTKPVSLLNKASGGGSEYVVHIHTADRMGAALPAGQSVCVEVLGSIGALLTTQLPRARGSFQRGCVDSFSLSSAAGDVGRIEAAAVWQVPGGSSDSSIGGSWCLQRLDVEAVFRGVTYRFTTPPAGCWVRRGAEHTLKLTQPRVVRAGDVAAVMAEAEELQRQLDSNAALEPADRALLASRLQKLRARLEGAQAV